MQPEEVKAGHGTLVPHQTSVPFLALADLAVVASAVRPETTDSGQPELRTRVSRVAMVIHLRITQAEAVEEPEGRVCLGRNQRVWNRITQGRMEGRI